MVASCVRQFCTLVACLCRFLKKRYPYCQMGMKRRFWGRNFEEGNLAHIAALALHRPSRQFTSRKKCTVSTWWRHDLPNTSSCYLLQSQNAQCEKHRIPAVGNLCVLTTSPPWKVSKGYAQDAPLSKVGARSKHLYHLSEVSILNINKNSDFLQPTQWCPCKTFYTAHIKWSNSCSLRGKKKECHNSLIIVSIFCNNILHTL